MTDLTSPNAEQIEAWNEGVGKAWIANVDALDRQIAPIGEAALKVAAVKAGDSVLDIGCGAGQTAIELARRVGEAGWAHGVDISGLMIGAAGTAVRQQSVLNVSFEIADAQTCKFRPAAYEVIFSRFGVMFFQDPPAAFANIRAALSRTGHMAFCCWRAPAENPLMSLPLRAAANIVPAPDGPPGDPTAPGPFASSDPDRVRIVLASAGFTEISIEKWDGLMGANPADEAIRITTELGPLGRRLNEMKADASLRQRVRDVVREGLQDFIGSDGNLRAPGAAWIVRAGS